GPGFYLRSVATNTEYSVPAGADVDLSELLPRAPSLLHRGAIHDAFTHLFELAFDQAALDALPLDEGLSARASPPPGADLSPSSTRQELRKPAAIGAVALGGAALATAGVLAIDGARLHGEAARDDTSGDDRARLNQEIATRNRWTAIAGIGGAALIAAG